MSSANSVRLSAELSIASLAGNYPAKQASSAPQLVYPQNRLKYEPIVAAQTIPVLRLDSVRELNRYYRFWGLKRP